MFHQHAGALISASISRDLSIDLSVDLRLVSREEIANNNSLDRQQKYSIDPFYDSVMILYNSWVNRSTMTFIESLSSVRDEVGPSEEERSPSVAASAVDRPRSISFYRCVRTRNGTVINFAALGAPVARVPSSRPFFPARSPGRLTDDCPYISRRARKVRQPRHLSRASPYRGTAHLQGVPSIRLVRMTNGDLLYSMEKKRDSLRLAEMYGEV